MDKKKTDLTKGSTPKTTPELTEKQLKNVSGGAAVDYFLKIDGVDGESTDDKHKGEIQLQSFRKP